MSKNNAVSIRIKQIRTKRGITQEELSELSGLSHISIATIETGARFPRMASLVKIAKALGTTTDELLHGHEYDESNAKIKGKTNFKVGFEKVTHSKANVDVTSLDFSSKVLEALAKLPLVHRQFALALIFRDEGYLDQFDELTESYLALLEAL